MSKVKCDWCDADIELGQEVGIPCDSTGAEVLVLCEACFRAGESE